MNEKYLTRKVTIDRAGMARLIAIHAFDDTEKALFAGGNEAVYAMLDTLSGTTAANEMLGELFKDGPKAHTISGGRYAVAALSAILRAVTPPDDVPAEKVRAGCENVAYTSLILLTDIAKELFGEEEDEDV